MLGLFGISGNNSGFFGYVPGICIPISGPISETLWFIVLWLLRTRGCTLAGLSVSPFNNEAQIGEYLRGSNVVYYSKPRAEFVTHPGPMNEEALRKYFKEVCEASSGCMLEIAQREVGTIFGDFERGRRYVEIAKECVADYWQP